MVDTRASSATAKDWRDRWQHQDAWTVREFARLCCGWNPSVYEFPNRDLYNEALESINRAVRVKALPTIELLWPATGAERLYDSVPMFGPREVASWAAKRYPGVFPYSADAWEDKFASAGVVTEPAEGGAVTAFKPEVRPTVEKRMQELRKVLRQHFKSERFDISPDSDPLGVTWQSHSARSQETPGQRARGCGAHGAALLENTDSSLRIQFHRPSAIFFDQDIDLLLKRDDTRDVLKGT